MIPKVEAMDNEMEGEGPSTVASQSGSNNNLAPVPSDGAIGNQSTSDITKSTGKKKKKVKKGRGREGGKPEDADSSMRRGHLRRAVPGPNGARLYMMPPLPPMCATLGALRALLLDRARLLAAAGRFQVSLLR